MDSREIQPSAHARRQLDNNWHNFWFSMMPHHSYTHAVLKEFRMADEYLLNLLSHPQLLDSLDASCEEPPAERPNVHVVGEMIQEGVMLATALEVDGERSVFLPSGFFRELSEGLRPFLTLGHTEAPRILSAVESG